MYKMYRIWSLWIFVIKVRFIPSAITKFQLLIFAEVILIWWLWWWWQIKFHQSYYRLKMLFDIAIRFMSIFAIVSLVRDSPAKETMVCCSLFPLKVSGFDFKPCADDKLWILSCPPCSQSFKIAMTIPTLIMANVNINIVVTHWCSTNTVLTLYCVSNLYWYLDTYDKTPPLRATGSVRAVQVYSKRTHKCLSLVSLMVWLIWRRKLFLFPFLFLMHVTMFDIHTILSLFFE